MEVVMACGMIQCLRAIQMGMPGGLVLLTHVSPPFRLPQRITPFPSQQSAPS
jgi:hypothetical protein